ncbi:MAG: M48 family metallopeptidase, partial [Deltaproteobacteria bacterium]|nr:M48 family metallopeptidase [Deltaproteobacteria bacterium]
MSAKTHERKRFPKLSIRAIEHPADRAALTTLRKVPGFDIALKKLIGLLGERSLRTIYLASAVRVNERQFGDLFKIYSECIEILDVEEQPELFVSQTPFVNAGAIGTDRPFIVLNSATIALLSNDELRFILGHELGHILSDHVLYKTMLNLLLRMSVVRFGIPLGWLAIFAIIAALNEWDRKSELSADRAGVLCVQDPPTSYGVFMKLSGGASADQMNLDEFIRQAEDYESGGDKLDS